MSPVPIDRDRILNLQSYLIAQKTVGQEINRSITEQKDKLLAQAEKQNSFFLSKAFDQLERIFNLIDDIVGLQSEQLKKKLLTYEKEYNCSLYLARTYRQFLNTAETDQSSLAQFNGILSYLDEKINPQMKEIFPHQEPLFDFLRGNSIYDDFDIVIQLSGDFENMHIAAGFCTVTPDLQEKLKSSLLNYMRLVSFNLQTSILPMLRELFSDSTVGESVDFNFKVNQEKGSRLYFYLDDELCQIEDMDSQSNFFMRDMQQAFEELVIKQMQPVLEAQQGQDFNMAAFKDCGLEFEIEVLPKLPPLHSIQE